MTDWNKWLARYDNPQSPFSRRLLTVQRLIHRRLDRTAPHPVSILSLCAGDGRDILEVLSDRDDAARVKATLVEVEPRLCVLARARVTENALTGIEIKQADAGTTDTFAGGSPADLVILVGVFGNISDTDVRATVEILPAFCKPNALVIWSLRRKPRRHPVHQSYQNDHERVEKVREWFDAERFLEVFSNRNDAAFHVGAYRFKGEPPALPPARRFFSFDQLPGGDAVDELPC